MASHILRFRQADRNIFDDVRSGKKTVETRAATVKFRNIKPGDAVIFICGSDKFEKEVQSAETFKGIAEMLTKHNIGDIAPSLTNKEELEKMYYSFPGYREKIEQFGLIALKFA